MNVTVVPDCFVSVAVRLTFLAFTEIQVNCWMVTSMFGTGVDGALRDDFLMPLLIPKLFMVRAQAAYFIFTSLVTYLSIFCTNIHGSQTTNGFP